MAGKQPKHLHGSECHTELGTKWGGAGPGSLGFYEGSCGSDLEGRLKTGRRCPAQAQFQLLLTMVWGGVGGLKNWRWASGQRGPRMPGIEWEGHTLPVPQVFVFL